MQKPHAPSLTDRTLTAFETHYSMKPRFLSRAPGRVNLIGEHVDYAGGFVLPAAIDREVIMVAAPNDQNTVTIRSASVNAFVTLEPDSLTPEVVGKTWSRYFASAMVQVQSLGMTIPGLNVFINSSVPTGSGVSSSAAFTVAALNLLVRASESEPLEPKQIALMAQAAEHHPLVGTHCGIMDQYISAMGKEGCALLLDCHSLESRPIPFPAQHATILVANTMKTRGLVGSEYNTRREQAELGLADLQKASGQEFATLRHLPRAVLEQYSGALEEVNLRRVRHHVSENERTLRVADALESGDIVAAGGMLTESHASLRDDYEVSCPELDSMVSLLLQADGVYGARMMGAGFGGCTIALVSPAKVRSVCDYVTEAFRHRWSVTPETLVISRPGPGALSRVV